MKIKIYSVSGILPAYETVGASGMDMRAYISETVTIAPGKRAMIPTGISIELPPGFEAQIRARSGLAAKYGICLANGIGTIDSDYRGELRVPMVNLSNEPYTIQPGERVAQLCIAPVWQAAFTAADALSDTDRGAGGFGSTGK